ncbi:hypothetical protein [Paraburkholderia xenovorans]
MSEDDLFQKSVPATRVELPEPVLERWQPLRLGVVELFHYDMEEFWFHDGRLLFRGNNGTGKSKVLSLTLPFLFDANLRSSRVERMRSTNDAPQSKVAERMRCGSDAGQRRSAGIFQGSNAS